MISSRWLCEEDGNRLCGLPWFQEGQLEVCKELAGDTGKWRSWPDTKRTGKVSRVGEFPGELEACKESSILPAQPSFYLQTWTIKGREGKWVPWFPFQPGSPR